MKNISLFHHFVKYSLFQFESKQRKTYMAAFSSTSFHHHHPFLLGSVVNFLPSSPSTTIDNKNIIMSMSPPLLLHQSPLIANNNLNLVDNDASVVNKNSMDNSSSIVTDKYDDSTHAPINNCKKRKCKAASSANSAQSKVNILYMSSFTLAS